LTNGTTLSSPGLALLFELATTQVKKGTPSHAVLTISIGRPNNFLDFFEFQSNLSMRSPLLRSHLYFKVMFSYPVVENSI